MFFQLDFSLGSREWRAGALNLLVGGRWQRFAWTVCAPLEPAVTQVHAPFDLFCFPLLSQSLLFPNFLYFKCYLTLTDYTIMIMHIICGTSIPQSHTITLCVCVLSQHPQCSDIGFPEEGSGGKWTLHSEWRCQVSLSICLFMFFFFPLALTLTQARLLYLT